MPIGLAKGGWQMLLGFIGSIACCLLSEELDEPSYQKNVKSLETAWCPLKPLEIPYFKTI